jgi:predicted permease
LRRSRAIYRGVLVARQRVPGPNSTRPAQEQIVMPPVDQPPAADGAGRRPPSTRRALRLASEERQIMAGCIVLNIGAMLVLTVATFAFKSTGEILLVGGGAILAVLVLAFVLNRYAPAPKVQPVRRIDDEGVGWAIWQAGYLIISLIILWHTFDEANRNSWDIWRGLLVLMLISSICLATSNLMRWGKARRAGRDQGKAEP